MRLTTKEMRVIVCGGRHSREHKLVWKYLDQLLDAIPNLTIIQGGARGVDKFARDWCMKRGVDFINYPYPAGYGCRAGGPIRNRQMIVDGKPDFVVAFPGGRGTRNMVRQAREHWLKVVEIDKDGIKEPELTLGIVAPCDDAEFGMKP
jgi:hypothetical protein